VTGNKICDFTSLSITGKGKIVNTSFKTKQQFNEINLLVKSGFCLCILMSIQNSCKTETRGIEL
jgi:hypothetical protein